MLRVQKSKRQPHDRVLDEFQALFGPQDEDLAAISDYWTKNKGDVRRYHLGTPKMQARRRWTPEMEAAMQKRVSKWRAMEKLRQFAANGSPRAQVVLRATDAMNTELTEGELKELYQR